MPQSPLEKHFQELNELARTCELPEQWIICPNCGTQAWVLPPHGLDPCPIVVQAMEQLGMKLDAERMTAVRTGVSIEEITRAARELGGGAE